jgi:hypothetical protein
VAGVGKCRLGQVCVILPSFSSLDFSQAASRSYFKLWGISMAGVAWRGVAWRHCVSELAPVTGSEFGDNLDRKPYDCTARFQSSRHGVYHFGI